MRVGGLGWGGLLQTGDDSLWLKSGERGGGLETEGKHDMVGVEVPVDS